MLFKVKGKFRAYDFFEYLLALTLVLNCRSMWTTIPGIAVRFSDFLLCLVGVAVGGCIIATGKAKLKQLGIGVSLCSLIVVYFIMFLLVNRYSQMGVIKFTILVCFFLLYYSVCVPYQKTSTLLIKYVNVVVIIAIVSMCFWILGSILHIIKPTGFVMTNWTGVDFPVKKASYYGLYFETQEAHLLGNLTITRNTSIFTEAPMASCVFSIAFLIELFCLSKISRWKCAVLMISILTTFSTTGCVIVVLALGAKFLLSNPHSSIVRFMKRLVIPGIIIACGFIAYWLITSKLNTSSGSVRIDDFVVGFKAWMKNPLFGCGFGNTVFIQTFMGGWRIQNMGYSNSPMQILAHGGIYFALPYILCILSGVRKCLKSKDWKQLSFILSFIFIFTITIISYQYLTVFLFIFIAFKDDKKSIFRKMRILNE